MIANTNVSTLNSLIATTIDSIDGYEEAAKDATNQRYATLFRERATERRQIADQLKAEVRRLGAEPEDDGSLLAGAHRMFLNLRDTVTGTDDKAVIAEVERGEDHIKAKFEAAINDEDLDPHFRAVAERCFTSVKQGHDQMSALKHSMEASS